MAGDFVPYVTGDGMGHCIGLAYSEDYCYTVRAHTCTKKCLRTGVYRAKVTSVVTDNNPVEAGDSSRIVYVTMNQSVYMGESVAPNLFDFRRDLFNSTYHESRSAIEELNRMWFEDVGKIAPFESEVEGMEEATAEVVEKGKQLTVVEEKKEGSSATVIGPAGKQITIREFEEKTKFGCSVCTGNIYITDAPNLEWLDGRTPLCLHCKTERQIESIG